MTADEQMRPSSDDPDRWICRACLRTNVEPDDHCIICGAPADEDAAPTIAELSFWTDATEASRPPEDTPTDLWLPTPAAAAPAPAPAPALAPTPAAGVRVRGVRTALTIALTGAGVWAIAWFTVPRAVEARVVRTHWVHRVRVERRVLEPSSGWGEPANAVPYTARCEVRPRPTPEPAPTAAQTGTAGSALAGLGHGLWCEYLADRWAEVGVREHEGDDPSQMTWPLAAVDENQRITHTAEYKVELDVRGVRVFLPPEYLADETAFRRFRAGAVWSVREYAGGLRPLEELRRPPSGYGRGVLK
jgi:hypothetical protein